MRLSDVAFLAADTLRSRAYAQVMLAGGFTLERCIMVRSPNARPPEYAASDSPATADGLVLPDLGIPLDETVAALCHTAQIHECGTVNDDSVVQSIRATGARLVIYSGFGGEIVRGEVLKACPPFLHMHAGWLPEYRGSTTVYYSYLRERSFGVSALVLDSNIDAGPIVARRRYPPPPAGMDVDHLYDSAIRADLLNRVLGHYAAEGRLPEPLEQPAGAGHVYYIIHPVLKHLALNRLHRAKPEE